MWWQGHPPPCTAQPGRTGAQSLQLQQRLHEARSSGRACSKVPCSCPAPFWSPLQGEGAKGSSKPLERTLGGGGGALTSRVLQGAGVQGGPALAGLGGQAQAGLPPAAVAHRLRSAGHGRHHRRSRYLPGKPLGSRRPALRPGLPPWPAFEGEPEAEQPRASPVSGRNHEAGVAAQRVADSGTAHSGLVRCNGALMLFAQSDTRGESCSLRAAQRTAPPCQRCSERMHGIKPPWGGRDVRLLRSRRVTLRPCRGPARV